MRAKQKFPKTQKTMELVNAVTGNVYGTKDFNALLVPIVADIATSLAMIVDKIYEEKTDEISNRTE